MERTRTAVEMPGGGQPWKTVIAAAMGASRRFPTATHRPWKTLRVSHIPTAAAATPLLDENNERKAGFAAPQAPLFRLILQ